VHCTSGGVGSVRVDTVISLHLVPWYPEDGSGKIDGKLPQIAWDCSWVLPRCSRGVDVSIALVSVRMIQLVGCVQISIKRIRSSQEVKQLIVNTIVTAIVFIVQDIQNRIQNVDDLGRPVA